jgi:hypothetical protein
VNTSTSRIAAFDTTQTLGIAAFDETQTLGIAAFDATQTLGMVAFDTTHILVIVLLIFAKGLRGVGVVPKVTSEAHPDNSLQKLSLSVTL